MNFFRFSGVSFHTFLFGLLEVVCATFSAWFLARFSTLNIGNSHRVNSPVLAFALAPLPASEHAMWGAFRTCRAQASLSRPCISKDTMNVAHTKERLFTYKVLAGLPVSLRTIFVMESCIYL